MKTETRVKKQIEIIYCYLTTPMIYKSLTIFFITISLAFQTYAQKIALLHKEFKEPIIFTDSLTVEQVHSGYFPIEVNNIDTFYANLNYLKQMLGVRQRAKLEAFELRAGNSQFKIERVPFAYGDKYSIKAHNKINEIESIYTISRMKLSNKKNAERINDLMKYISNNKSLFKIPYEIHPKIYNVVVITEH